MAFKQSRTEGASLESPEALLRDLKGRKVPGLLSHQADVIRAYVDTGVEKSDVALQLPTGSGKTLVGLLLGEWRRRRFKERVVYLCPTNQLVNQVAQQAQLKFGMRVTAFTGRKRDYPERSVAEYVSGETLAVTSYSALFNSDPFFDDPNLIILDDAHAAEGYIASAWSLRVERYDDSHAPLFTALVGALQRILPPSDLHRLVSEPSTWWDVSWVEKLPTPVVTESLEELRAIIGAHVGDSDLRYPWSFLQNHLHACHWYVGSTEILIRPLIPPTNTHRPFARAGQRVYMSATLGEGGELERLTGRPSILRLPVPSGWDKQGNGRRFFVFPTRSLPDANANKFLLEVIKVARRALFLVPDLQSSARVSSLIADTLGWPVFSARDIEHSKDGFVNAPEAVAVVANRYDGIDFLQDECRLEIVEGLPKAINLQERFLVNKMGAAMLLNDRILTRIVQAFGRCTRDATDFAIVVVLGDEMLAYLLRREHRDLLHPELQAELEFGMEQSKDISATDLIENARFFLVQSDEWRQAEAGIVSMRESLKQQTFRGTAQLRAAVDHELEYQYAMWQGDFVSALGACRGVLAQLAAPELRGYRALWHYLAGSAAWLAWREGHADLDGAAREHFKAAMAAATGIRWLVALSRMTDQDDAGEGPTNDRLLRMIERLEARLEELGMVHDRSYAVEEAFILKNLKDGDSTAFEQAQVRLGKLLGFDAGNVETTGAPDPWWIVDDDLCLVFEDYTDAKEGSVLSVRKARQVATHPNWVRENLPVRPTADVLPILVSSVRKADTNALTHLKNVAYWDVDEFRRWATQAVMLVRELRQSYPGPADIAWRAQAIDHYERFGLSPDRLIAILRGQPAHAALSSGNEPVSTEGVS
jgi:hypothetical protein